MPVRAIYRGQLATVTECMGNPHGPSDPADVPGRFRLTPGGTIAIAGNQGAREFLASLWDMDGVVLDHELWVSCLDPQLVEDPTDAQVAAVELGTWPRIPSDRQVRRHFGAP